MSNYKIYSYMIIIYVKVLENIFINLKTLTKNFINLNWKKMYIRKCNILNYGVLYLYIKT
jgi:hypothetical protein